MEPRPPQHDREAPPPSRWGRFLEFMELSTPEGRGGLWLTLGLFVLCCAPLVLLGVLDLSPTPRRILAASGPVSICLGVAALILALGFRYGEALKMSRAKTWGLAALFLALGLAGGVALWFSEP